MTGCPIESSATPLWTTLLAFPQNGKLCLYLRASPNEHGHAGADEILELLAGHIIQLLGALEARSWDR